MTRSSLRRSFFVIVACRGLTACSVDFTGTAPDAAFTLDAGMSQARDPVPPDASVAREAGEAVDAQRAADAAASDGSVADAGAVADAGSTRDGSASACDAAGTFALQATFDVRWIGTDIASIVPLVSAGEGEVSWVMLAHFRRREQGLELELRSCQASIPEFVSTLPQEHYAVRFPDALWDSVQMPTWTAKVSGCEQPGCALSTGVVHQLIGATLTPDDAAWPRTISAGTWPDQDGDGRAGVSTFVLGPEVGKNNAYPPVDVLSSRRARSLAIGLRLTYALVGERDDCDTFNCAMSPGEIDSRAVDCLTTTSPAACSSSELSFLNDNLPVWTVTRGRLHGDRIADDAACDDVRRHFDIAPFP